MLYNLHFFPSKCRLFHNATLFGFCITHILNTGCAKICKKKSVAKRLISALDKGEWSELHSSRINLPLNIQGIHLRVGWVNSRALWKGVFCPLREPNGRSLSIPTELSRHGVVFWYAVLNKQSLRANKWAGFKSPDCERHRRLGLVKGSLTSSSTNGSEFLAETSDCKLREEFLFHAVKDMEVWRNAFPLLRIAESTLTGCEVCGFYTRIIPVGFYYVY